MERTTRRHLDRLVTELRADLCIVSAEVAGAFGAVPRHLFLPGVPLARSYVSDQAIATHFEKNGISVSSSSAPNIMAVMLEQLAVHPGHHVLEIGAGTGYNAALLAHLVGPTGAVVSIDLDPQITAEAIDHLARAGTTGVAVMAGDGWLGAPDHAGFDRIIATVEVWDISPHWESQLRDGGILVAPLWLRPGLSVVIAFEKAPEGAGLVSRSMHYCGFVPFRGPHAGPPRRVVVRGWADRAKERAKEPEVGSTWVAELDDATTERSELLARLAEGPRQTAPAPPPVVGWNTRLALEEPDSVTFFDTGTKGHSAVGLFDAETGSLALVDGTSIIGFGEDTCRQRLVASLERARPCALESLGITALPHDPTAQRDGVVLHRPNFDLVITGLDR
jgi:protein-L-isoaspartate(D-aspartate) O-methyltransferase